MAVNIELLNSESLTNIQTNFERVAEALTKVVGRTGDIPNQMDSDLDMDGNSILNAGDITVDGIGLIEAVEAAAASAASAAASAELIEGEVELAAAWAEGTTPGGPGTKSAKEWAQLLGEGTVGTVSFGPFLGDGVEDSFLLPISPEFPGNVFVFIDGVFQDFAARTIVGDTLTFSEPVPNGSTVYGIILVATTIEIGVPNTGSVTASSFDLFDLPNIKTALELISYETQSLTTNQQEQSRANIGITGNLLSRNVYTASDTWTKPDGCSYVKVVVVGAGGGGAGATAATGQFSAGSGGGAGEYAEKLINAIDLGATETITVATGGAGGTVSATPNNGSAGSGNSSFGAHVSAASGQGGLAMNTGAGQSVRLGGAGGNGGTGGDLNVKGQPGGNSIRFGSSDAHSGHGGAGPFGGGASGHSGAVVLNGLAGEVGGGGSGSLTYDSTSQRAGGAGGDGIVIVEAYGR